jgi:hypothetical protein
VELAQLGALKTLLREALASARDIRSAAADARAAVDAMAALRTVIDAVPQAASEAAAAAAMAAVLQMSCAGGATCARECCDRSGALQLRAAAVQAGQHNALAANERKQFELFRDEPTPQQLDQPATPHAELATAAATELCVPSRPPAISGHGAEKEEAAAEVGVLLDSALEPLRLELTNGSIADLRTDLDSALSSSGSPRRLSIKAPISAQRLPRQAAVVQDVSVVEATPDPLSPEGSLQQRLHLAGEAGAGSGSGAARGQGEGLHPRRIPPSGGDSGNGGVDLDRGLLGGGGADLISWLMGSTRRFEPGDPGPALSPLKPPSHPPASLLPVE